MNELSLFSGAGGGLLGTKHLLGWKTIGYVEWEEYPQKVLAQRIKDGFLDNAPIFTDIRAFISSGCAELYRGVTDVIAAGFPCQPFSVAGKRAGEDDPRNMWPSTLECIRIIRPRFAFLENVPGLLADRYIQRIFGDLAEAGFDARWIVLGADDCGAPHRRKRLWILAESSGTRTFRQEENRSDGGNRKEIFTNGIQATEGVIFSGNRSGENVAYPPLRQDNGRERGNLAFEETGRQGIYPAAESGREDVADSERFTLGTGLRQDEQAGEWRGRLSDSGCSWWDADPADGATESFVGRVVNGCSDRVDRLKCLGNMQVPIVAATAWRILSGGMK